MDDQVKPFDQPRSLSTDCGAWLACASIETPACCRIWLRVKEVISLAMSVSRMRDSAADAFSDGDRQAVDGVLQTVLHRTEVSALPETVLMAVSMVAIAVLAPAWCSTSTAELTVKDPVLAVASDRAHLSNVRTAPPLSR